MHDESPLRLTRRTLLTGSAALAGAAATRRIDSVFAAVTPSKLASDPRRPQFHLLPAANWMNDPNGPIFWRGQYHMFYQYNPDAAVWGNMHWGHAVSPDMIHWRHLPVALAPTPGGPDAGGVWTGSALPDGDRVALLYTGVVSAREDQATNRNGANSFRESQCLAFASGPNLTEFTKEPAAVIAAPPQGLDVTGFRDPAPWRDGDSWYMALGSGIRGHGGAVLLYRSADFHHWDYLHPLFQSAAADADHPVTAGRMWECPDFFPLGDRHVLIHSSRGKSFWQTGVLDRASMTFHPEREGLLDYGSFYAPKTQLDRHQNRILWGWIQEARPESEYSAAGWAGMMSLPRVLTLDADHNLQMTLAPEVDNLRAKTQRLNLSASEAAARQQLATLQIHGACGEVLCTFRRTADSFAVSLVSGEKSWLTCRFDPANPEEIVIDNQRLPIGTATNPQVDLRFLIDGSVIECMANNRSALTKRFYYEGSAAPPIAVQIQGRIANIESLTAWQLSPISTNRLTT